MWGEGRHFSHTLGGLGSLSGYQQHRDPQGFYEPFRNQFWVTQPPYCQNCECNGCKMHRESLRLQQEEALQREHVQQQAMKYAQLHTFLGDVDAATGERIKPGSVVKLKPEPEKKRNWPLTVFKWTFWTAFVLFQAQCLMWLFTRNV